MPIVASNQLTLFDFYDNKQLALNIRTSRPTVVVWDGESSYTPDYTLDPQDFIPEVSVLGESEILTTNIISCKWSVEDETGETTLTGNEPGHIFVPVGSGALRTLRLTKNPLTDKNFIRYNLTLVVKDEVTEENLTISGGVSLVRLTNGSDAVVLNLTNDHVSLPALHDGTVVNYTGAATTVQILKGTEDISSEWELRAEPGPGVTGTFINATYTVTALEEDTGTITLFASRGERELSKVFTLNKIRSGRDATVYRLKKSDAVLIRDRDGYLNPPFVSFLSEALDTNGGAKVNPGYLVIYERALKALTVDEYTLLAKDNLVLPEREYVLADIEHPYVKRYQSLTPEHTKAYVPNGDTHSIHVELYRDSEFTELLDTETVHIASDGKDPYRVEIISSQGDKFKVGQVETTLSALVYRGEEDVTDAINAARFQWTRTSLNPAADQDWNFQNAGGKKDIRITNEDVLVRATFHCHILKGSDD